MKKRASSVATALWFSPGRLRTQLRTRSACLRGHLRAPHKRVEVDRRPLSARESAGPQIVRWIAIVAASGVLVGGCAHGGIQRSLSPGSISSSPSSSGASITTTTAATTRATGDPVKGTTFSGCSAVTSEELISWEVDPASKQDAHNIPFGQNVRGCMWVGPKWGIKIYAVDANLDQLEQPQRRFDRQERVQIGSRSGWLVHTTNAMGCSIAIPSQQGVAAVQVDLKLDLTEQRFDQCPLALRIMKHIEPKIP